MNNKIPNRAEKLNEIHLTVSPEPLRKPKDLKAFYNPKLNNIRGGDQITQLRLGLERAHRKKFYKAFLIGPQGVGKSTELSRLIQKVDDKYQPLHLGIAHELDPVNFEPFDLLFLMMITLIETCTKPQKEGGPDTGETISEKLLEQIWDWFATEKVTHEAARRIGPEIAASAGMKKDTLLAKVLGLTAALKDEIKYASARNKKVVESRRQRTPQLIHLINNLLQECGNRLYRKNGKDWLFIVENFDKPYIPEERTRTVFINHANIFRDLQTHFIFTLPLEYSSQTARLPVPANNIVTIPDTPIFDSNHTKHTEGHQALRETLEARVNPEIFAEGQIDRLITASGGNLHDLFSMVNEAADSALLRKDNQGRVEAQDSDNAINNMHVKYKRRLGAYPYAPEEITYAQKAERLLKIYNNEETAKIRDPILLSLLRSQVIQKFAGRNGFGVHPLVVEILQEQKRLNSVGRL